MSANYMQAHSMASKGGRYANFVDIFYERDGQAQLIETLHIDVVRDLGLDDDSISLIHRGGRVAVELRAVENQQ